MIEKSKIKINVIEEAGYNSALFGLGLSYGITSKMDYEKFCEDENAKKKLSDVAVKLATRDGGHNKFLESIKIWLDVNAPLFWWTESDTYRLTSKQSASTMHTLVKEIKQFSEFLTNYFGLDNKEHEDFCDIITEIKLAEWHSGGKSVFTDYLKSVEKYVIDNFDVWDDRSVENIMRIVIEMAYQVAKCDQSEENLIYCKANLPSSYMQRREWAIDYKTLRNIVMQRFNHRLPQWRIFCEEVMKKIKHPELIKKEITTFGGISLK